MINVKSKEIKVAIDDRGLGIENKENENKNPVSQKLSWSVS